MIVRSKVAASVTGQRETPFVPKRKSPAKPRTTGARHSGRGARLLSALPFGPLSGGARRCLGAAAPLAGLPAGRGSRPQPQPRRLCAPPRAGRAGAGRADNARLCGPRADWPRAARAHDVMRMECAARGAATRAAPAHPPARRARPRRARLCPPGLARPPRRSAGSGTAAGPSAAPRSIPAGGEGKSGMSRARAAGTGRCSPGHAANRGSAHGPARHWQLFGARKFSERCREGQRCPGAAAGASLRASTARGGRDPAGSQRQRSPASCSASSRPAPPSRRRQSPASPAPSVPCSWPRRRARRRAPCWSGSCRRAPAVWGRWSQALAAPRWDESPPAAAESSSPSPPAGATVRQSGRGAGVAPPAGRGGGAGPRGGAPAPLGPAPLPPPGAARGSGRGGERGGAGGRQREGIRGHRGLPPRNAPPRIATARGGPGEGEGDLREGSAATVRRCPAAPGGLPPRSEVPHAVGSPRRTGKAALSTGKARARRWLCLPSGLCLPAGLSRADRDRPPERRARGARA